MRPSAHEPAHSLAIDCPVCAQRGECLFADALPDDLSRLHGPLEGARFGAGNALYHIGVEGRQLFALKSGLVKLVRFLPDGTQRIVRLLRPGAVAGLEVLLVPAYDHTAVAVRPVEACVLPRDAVERLSRDAPRLHAGLQRRWHAALRQADEWLVELSTGNARQRVARLFLHLGADRPDQPVELFGREDLGAMLGLTMETASRTIAEFKRAGTIEEIAPNLFRVCPEALRALSADA